MSEYIFTRSLGNNRYNIENTERVDVESNQIHIGCEVVNALPGKIFKIICNGNECKFIFNSELTSGEQTTLANIITAHINNT